MKRSDIRNFFRALHEGTGFKVPMKKMKSCNECGYMSEAGCMECSTCGCSEEKLKEIEIPEDMAIEGNITPKYDDHPALKGDQDKLPDKLQKGIIDKTEEK